MFSVCPDAFDSLTKWKLDKEKNAATQYIMMTGDIIDDEKTSKVINNVYDNVVIADTIGVLLVSKQKQKA